jgi:hypothetical protein
MLVYEVVEKSKDIPVYVVREYLAPRSKKRRKLHRNLLKKINDLVVVEPTALAEKPPLRPSSSVKTTARPVRDPVVEAEQADNHVLSKMWTILTHRMMMVIFLSHSVDGVGGYVYEHNRRFLRSLLDHRLEILVGEGVR